MVARFGETSGAQRISRVNVVSGTQVALQTKDRGQFKCDIG
jgi:hypothetical protein